MEHWGNTVPAPYSGFMLSTTGSARIFIDTQARAEYPEFFANGRTSSCETSQCVERFSIFWESSQYVENFPRCSGAFDYEMIDGHPLWTLSPESPRHEKRPRLPVSTDQRRNRTIATHEYMRCWMGLQLIRIATTQQREHHACRIPLFHQRR